MDRQTLRFTVLTTVASAVSLLAGEICRLPEVYWAVITTVVVMQSTLGTAWSNSRQRLIGTVLGGITGPALGLSFEPGLLQFMAGMLLMGLLCATFRLKISAYRFAGVTLAIVLLPAHAEPMCMVALHRFIEVAFGILAAMAVMAIWPEPEDAALRPAPMREPASDKTIPAKERNFHLLCGDCKFYETFHPRD